ncbi:MAG: DNA internalization-related competence protein ComEC/Rec2 [Peptococcaceae bacterium]|nr:DNA internalization-related competence protein ComEC/Rec2 [Peptococcaceae bacterium]MDH7524489.1 DNA internalization-related competence protein ComEC/Rec2 [Peptococcaceae bacterium]
MTEEQDKKIKMVNRQLFLFAVCFGFGIALGRCCRLEAPVWLAVAAAAAAFNGACLFKKGRVLTAAVLACAVLGGAFWFQLSRSAEGLYDGLAGQTVQGKGTIVTYPRSNENSTVLVVGVEELSYTGGEITGIKKLMLKAQKADGELCLPGASVHFNGEWSLPRGPRNPGEFDYRDYLANQEIFYQVDCRHAGIKLAEEGGGLRAVAARGRQKISACLARILPERERGLLLGLLFGDVSAVSGDDWEGYQRAGVVHLFAVSGFNVAFVLGVASFFLSFLGTGPLGRMLLGTPVLVGYYFLVGWSASIVRASLMAFLGMLALFAGRKRDVYTSIGVAALVILLLCPGELFQAGFQLSFAVTAGIVHLAPFLEKRGLGKALASTLAAQLAAAPLVAYYFNLLSLVAPLLNIIAVSVSGLATVLGLAGCLLTWLAPPLAEPLFLTAGGIVYFLSELVLKAASWEWAALLLPTPSLGTVVICCLVLLLLPYWLYLAPLWRWLPAWWKFFSCALLLAGLLSCCWPGARRMEVVFLDVGQGDCIFIRTPSGRTVLVDGGGTPDSAYQVGKKTVRPYLRRRGIGKIDLAVMSHSDLDHSEGLMELISCLRVGTFLMPPRNENDRVEEEIARLCRERKIPLGQLAAGERIDFGDGVVLETLHPAKGDKTTGNDHSLVLKVVFQETEWLLTGDIENAAIEKILAHPSRLASDVLKLPHHGSATSYSPAFYREVAPKVVVVSAGLKTHPHQEVVEYFRKRGVPCFVTRERGAVITESDGRTLRVRAVVPGKS